MNFIKRLTFFSGGFVYDWTVIFNVLFEWKKKQAVITCQIQGLKTIF